jgi:FAD synthase
MGDNNADSLQKKKEELEAELDKIEYMLDDSFDKVKTDVSSFDPREFIRRKPLAAVGACVVLGFVFGSKGKKKSSSPDAVSQERNIKLSSTIWNEIKRVAVRKTVNRAGDYIEDLLDELQL